MGIISSKPQPATLLAPSMEGNLDEVKRLIGIYIADNNDKSALATYINATDPAGNAAIHGAVFSGHLNVLKFLVESCSAGDSENDGSDGEGIDLTVKNGLGCSPMWIAAGYDRIECLEYLIEILQEAKKLEEALLDANSTGDTPFIAAASKGNLNACKCLLSSTEDNELKRNILRTANATGDTALKVAVASAQSDEVLKLLLETDDTLYSKDGTSGGSDDDDLLMHQKCVNRKNNAGLSPLIVACERNLPSTAELLLKHGADICIKDSKGRNTLAVSAFCGCNDVVEFLLNKENVLAKLLNEKDENGCTPLWLAARTGNLSMVKLLMDAGADATITNEEGLSPQEVAVKFKKEKVMEYFTQ